MKFAICNETYVDWPLKDALACSKKHGYTGIEIAPFTLAKDAREISAPRRAEVREMAAKAEIDVIGLHWLLAKTEGYYVTTPDLVVRRRTGEYFVELARLCSDLGGKVMVFGSPMQRNVLPGVTNEQAMDYAEEVLRAAAPAFEDFGVVLAVEPLGPQDGNFLLTADSAQELIERVGSPYVRLHLDCKAMASEPTPIPDIIRKHARLLEHFHANDANRRGPGTGDLDFLPIFRTLGEVGYDGWVSVEVFDYTPDPETIARESIEYMKGCLAEIAAG